MNIKLEEKLKFLKDFQIEYPTSHVGGSIGLLLRGYDLKRDLGDSDIDVIVDEFDPSLYNNNGSVSEKSGDDFDYRIYHYLPNLLKIKMDIRITPEPSFDIVEYQGVEYNVSKLRDIIFWKKKYSIWSKHRQDLINIGVLPKVEYKPTESKCNLIDDDLPF